MMTLIPNWRAAWRFASVQAALWLTVLSVLQMTVLPLWQFAVPAEWWPYVTAGAGTLIALLRVIAQPGVHTEPGEPAAAAHAAAMADTEPAVWPETAPQDKGPAP